MEERHGLGFQVATSVLHFFGGFGVGDAEFRNLDEPSSAQAFITVRPHPNCLGVVTAESLPKGGGLRP